MGPSRHHLFFFFFQTIDNLNYINPNPMQEMDREENIHDKPMTSTEKPVHSKQQEVNAFFALQFQHDEKFKAAQKSGPFTNANSTADGSKADPKAKHTTKPKGKAEPKPATKKAAAAKKRK